MYLGTPTKTHPSLVPVPFLCPPWVYFCWRLSFSDCLLAFSSRNVLKTERSLGVRMVSPGADIVSGMHETVTPIMNDSLPLQGRDLEVWSRISAAWGLKRNLSDKMLAWKVLSVWGRRNILILRSEPLGSRNPSVECWVIGPMREHKSFFLILAIWPLGPWVHSSVDWHSRSFFL